MGNLGSSLIILLIALVLLWLAVTDKFNRVLDAWDVIIGKEDKSKQLVSGPQGTQPVVSISLPSLPVLSLNTQVPA